MSIKACIANHARPLYSIGEQRQRRVYICVYVYLVGRAGRRERCSLNEMRCKFVRTASL